MNKLFIYLFRKQNANLQLVQTAFLQTGGQIPAENAQLVPTVVEAAWVFSSYNLF